MDRRSKYEIYIEILSAIKNGINLPTPIMYNTCLSWKSITQILNSLEGLGFIENRCENWGKRSNKEYFITEKGEEFLFNLNNVIELLAIETVDV